MNIPASRLKNQKISPSLFEKPSDVVRWFGAMQAQYFLGAKWGVGLRTHALTDDKIEQAFNKGEILRTHIMRPTWHFVTPEDIYWMLALTSPRVHAFNGHYYRKSRLDKTIFQKSNEIMQNVLRGSKQLTRTELNVHFAHANIPVKDMGLTYTILQAELDGIICSGPRIGKQFTYMLLSERVPKRKELERDEALGELAKRYFQSHGPAQIQDFSWWSGLTTTDAKRAVEIAKLQKETVDGKAYWFTEQTDRKSLSAHLLPPFDEYFVAYKDRGDILDERYKKHMNFGGGMINGAILINGIVVGTWKSKFSKTKIVMTLFPFEKFSPSDYEMVEEAANRYAQFYALPVNLQ